jgi:hypothetical protein
MVLFMGSAVIGARTIDNCGGNHKPDRARGRQASEGKHFFFEKKKQKTSISWLLPTVRPH